MTNAYTWTIASMPAYPEAEGQTDVVFQINWVCTATDEKDPDKAASLSGTTAVAYKAGDPYAPYSKLTKAQVLEWVWAVTPQEGVQTYLDGQLNTVVLPLPWGETEDAA